MSGGLLVFSDELTRYDFGPDHPMAPGRVTNTISLARQLGVLDRLQIVPPSAVDSTTPLSPAAQPCFSSVKKTENRSVFTSEFKACQVEPPSSVCKIVP